MCHKTRFAFLILVLLAFYSLKPVSLIALESSGNVDKNINQEVHEKVAGKVPEKTVKTQMNAKTNGQNRVEKNSEKAIEKNPDKNAKKDIKKQAKKIEGDILRNPVLMDEFKQSYFDSSPTDHVVTTLFYGLLTGGIMGMAGGLSFYTTTTATDLTPLYISAGVVGITGALAGAIVAMVENSTHNPLLGSDLLKLTWYGVIGGAMIGSVAGLFPYSTTGDSVTLLNWIGYGSYAGIGVGVALFLILPKSTLTGLVINTTPAETKIGYKYQF